MFSELSNVTRRWIVLVLAILFLTVSAFFWARGGDSSTQAGAAVSGRIGFVLAALWLAWPSLSRPARWFPPAVAVIGVVSLMVIAAQPRLLLAVIPASGTLIALTMFFRGRSAK